MNCERCKSFRGGEAVFRIRTEILNLNVCGQCAKEARELGLLRGTALRRHGNERKESPTRYRLGT